MKTLRILGMILIAGFLFSCEKDIEKDQVKQDVSFGITEIDPTLLKSDSWDWECSDADPVSALIKIDGEWYNPQVFYLNGSLYTQAIKLATGTYQIEQFYVMDGMVDLQDFDENIMPQGIIKAAPLAEAPFANYVNAPLSITLNVGEFTKVEQEIEVLCYQPGTHEQFGFFWFNITEIVVREICLFGDLCIKDHEEYELNADGSISDYAIAFGNDGSLEAYPFDLPALFKVKAYKNGETEPYDIFENFDDENGVFTPGAVCVKFPVRLDGTQETFTFKLEVLVKQGDGFVYKPFAEWGDLTTSDLEAYLDNENDQKVWSFVVGSCNYNSDIVFPPYQNLPETANVTISIDTNDPFENGAYWALTVNSLSPAGSYDFPPPSTDVTYLGWCGDAATLVNTPYTRNFYIYSSLNDANWPANMPVTAANLAKVNWLFNNLPAGYPELTEMFITEGNFTPVTPEQGLALQQAIWLILGQTPPGNAVGAAGFPVQDAQDMATSAAGQADFVPLPGGYAAVLMVENDDPTGFQLIFTVVDP